LNDDRQATLFELPAARLAAAPQNPAHTELARRLSQHVRLGTMSWSFPGWRKLVYGEDAPSGSLSALGLSAYSQHPLLRAVEIDRSYYEALGAETLRAYAEQVPDDFRFLVKAHELCSVRRFPTHARYGRRGGELNAQYLDPSYASDAVVGPVRSALGERLGAILFQFPPGRDEQDPAEFAGALAGFLSRLPTGVPYAVELRQPGLLTPAYVEALAAHGAVHCHNAWSGMPPVLTQAKQVLPGARNPLIVRWLLAPGERYEDARDRFRPFDRITREDVPVRSAIARLVAKAAARGVPSLVLINNKAEGSAPASAFRLAEAIVEASARP
jgi:uncharacterized protein YecE (DUF72 family)